MMHEVQKCLPCGTGEYYSGFFLAGVIGIVNFAN